MKDAACPGTVGATAHRRPGHGIRGQHSRLCWPLTAALLLALLPTVRADSGALDPRPAEGDARPATRAAQSATHSLFLPLVIQSGRRELDTRFGMQLFEATEAQVAEATQAGVGRVRIPLYWSAVEPANTSPDEYRWSPAYDQGLERLAARNMDLILTFDGNPAWAATYAGGPIDRVPIGEFVEFVVAAVRRYSGPPYNVKLWEFYNEPDNGDPLWAVNSGLGYWGIDPEGYADMLAAVYQPIKEVDPEAQVLLGGIAYDFWEEEGGPFVPDFLDRVLEHGGGTYFDVMNFHYYPTAFGLKWAPYGPGLIGKTTFLRQKLASYGLDKPMLCTEAGVENVNTGTDELQSRYVPILYAQTMAADLLSLSWFMLVDQDPGYWKTGLLYSDLTRKPAFYAYRTAGEQLIDARYLGALSSEEKRTEAMEAYRFRARDGQTIIVAWTNDGSTYSLVVLTSRVLVVDKYGTETWLYDMSDGRKDGRTLIPVGSSPVYLYPES